MSKLIKKYQGSGKLYQYNQADNTYVHQQPALMTYTAQKQRKQQQQRREQEKKQKDQQNKRNKYNQEINTARQVFSRKHQKEQEAFAEIKKGQYHNKMDQTTQKVIDPVLGPTTTYKQTPEEEKITRPIPGYKDPVAPIISSIITWPFGGPLLKTAATKLVTTKFGRRLLYDIAANEAFNGIYSGVTDRDFASDINYISGLDNNNIFGDIASFSLTSAGRNALVKGIKNGLIYLPQTKRAVEATMRQTAFPEPLQTLLPTANSTPNYNINNIKSTVKWVLLGGNKPYDMRFNPMSHSRINKNYTGIDRLPGTSYSEPDLIDAFVYGKQLDPELATFLGYADDIKTGQDNWLSKAYKNKKHKIPVYEIGESNTALRLDKLFGDTDSEKRIFYDSYDLPSKKPGITFNTQGHMIEYTPKTGEVIETDVWGFNPEGYYKKWIEGTLEFTTPKKIPYINKEISAESLNNLVKWWLDVVNKVGNPVVLKTKPTYKPWTKK